MTAPFVDALAALAEPTRFRLVEELREGPRRVSDLVDALDVAQPQVSKHLRVLKEAGWVSVEAVAQERLYTLVPAHFIAFGQFLERYRQVWSERFTQLDALLAELQQAPSSSSSSSSPPAPPSTSTQHKQEKQHDRRRRRR